MLLLDVLGLVPKMMWQLLGTYEEVRHREILDLNISSLWKLPIGEETAFYIAVEGTTSAYMGPYGPLLLLHTIFPDKTSSSCH